MLGLPGELWESLSQWLEGLPPRTAAVLGALASALGLVLWQYVMLPLVRAGWKVLSARLYPLLSGAVIIDRVWSLPRYVKTLYGRVSYVSNPWLDERQKLTDIFVPVSATTGSSRSERTELSALFRTHRTFVVVGDPGSGKTTGLTSIALGCLTGKLRDDNDRPLVPVFVSLRRLALSKKTLDDFIVDEFATLGFPRARRLFKRLEHTRRIVFLLDGIDEVDENDRAALIEQIASLLERHRRDNEQCHVIVTSRPVGYDEQLRGQVDATVRMADFTLLEIRKFISNWEFPPPKSRDRLLGAITDRRPIFEICKNPLMLTIVTSLYRDYPYTLPDSREEFYRVCVDALLRRWDETRKLEDRNKIKASYKEAFLEEFAFEAIANALFDFTETRLLTKIEAFLQRHPSANTEATRFLTEILRSGLLARLQTGEIFFAHKTLAESLAALHLRNQSAQLVELWTQKPDAWLEVCSLFVAHPKTSDGEIARLLDAAEAKTNWNHLLVLAGEAHDCAPENRQRIADIMRQKELWPGLDNRAVAALARLGDEARPIVMEMVHSDVTEVRSRAIQALSTVPEPWAMQLLADLLVHRIDTTMTAGALAAMGADGLSLIARVLESHREDSVVILACLRMLEQIGTLEAFETVLPLLWERSHSDIAALTCARLLSETTLRRAFESNSSGGPVNRQWEGENQDLIRWSIPWLPANDQRTLCARVVELLAAWARTATPAALNELLVAGSPLLTIPAAILASPALRIDVDDELWGYRFSEQARYILYEATRRPVSNTQKLWEKSDDWLTTDIEYSHEVSIRFILFILAVVFLLPFGVAIQGGTISSWWLSVPVALFVTGFAVSVTEHDFSVLFQTMSLIPLGIAATAHAAFDDIELFARAFEPNKIITTVVLVVSCLTVTSSAVYAMWLMGGYWWLCALPNIVVALWYDGERERFVFVRRENPLAMLRLRLRAF